MPKIHFRLNGAETEIDADPDTPLLTALKQGMEPVPAVNADVGPK